MLPKIMKLINNTKAIFKIDSKPTKGSNNLITSGGVYTALNSGCNDAIIVMKPTWAEATFPSKLDGITVSTLPNLHVYKGEDLEEYLFQLLLIYVIIPTDNKGNVEVYPCKLNFCSNPGSGSKFIWVPTDDSAPFDSIEARYGLGANSWGWWINKTS